MLCIYELNMQGLVLVYETCECDIRIPDFHRLSQVNRLSTRPSGFGTPQKCPFLVMVLLLIVTKRSSYDHGFAIDCDQKGDLLVTVFS